MRRLPAVAAAWLAAATASPRPSSPASPSATPAHAQITLWDMPFEPKKYVDHAVAVCNCTLSDYKKETHGMSLNTRLDIGKKNTDEYPMPTRPSCARR